MPSRRIYTSSEVIITTPHATPVTACVGAVTSATYTRDTPREQVAVFGKSGQVDTVRNESTSSTIECVFHPTTGGAVDAGGASIGFGTGHLADLMTDVGKDTPTGSTVLVKGVGKLTGALLTSITAEGSVGALPTITMAFDGVGVADTTTATTETAAYSIANMQNVKLETAGNAEGGYSAGSLTSFAQSATFNWEFPVEKLNKISNSPDSATTYGTPPGTSSIAVEGIDDAGRIIEVSFGDWKFKMPIASKVSNVTNNMAVGEVGATYNTTTEGVAEGCTVS